MARKKLMTLDIFDVTDDTCSLTSKEAEVLVVTTGDGFLVESPLSAKGLMTLARMKKAQQKKAGAPDAEFIPNGSPVANGA
jgi:hypothetical protein